MTLTEKRTWYQMAARVLDTGDLGNHLRRQNHAGLGFSGDIRGIFDRQIDAFVNKYSLKEGPDDFNRELLWEQLQRELQYYGPSPMIVGGDFF